MKSVWEIKNYPDGGATLRNKDTGRYLDVAQIRRSANYLLANTISAPHDSDPEKARRWRLAPSEHPKDVGRHYLEMMEPYGPIDRPYEHAIAVPSKDDGRPYICPRIDNRRSSFKFMPVRC